MSKAMHASKVDSERRVRWMDAERPIAAVALAETCSGCTPHVGPGSDERRAVLPRAVEGVANEAKTTGDDVHVDCCGIISCQLVQHADG